jgi:hypothetical protein
MNENVSSIYEQLSLTMVTLDSNHKPQEPRSHTLSPRKSISAPIFLLTLDNWTYKSN